MLEVLSIEIKQIQMSNKQFRQFGIIVGIIFLLLSVYYIFTQNNILEGLIFVGLLLVILGIIYPRILAWPYKLWMILAVLLGFIFSHIILTVVYYIVIIPISLFLKIMKKDLLDINIDETEYSFWKKRKGKFSNMENLY